MNTSRRVVVGVSGASGMPYAVSLVQELARAQVQVHLIVSRAARKVLALETQDGYAQLQAAAHTMYEPDNIAASPASGSWLHDGMVVCPCSMASLAAMAHGLGANLMHRAADVTLKERRKLIIVARETPLSVIHLRNMLTLTEAGGIVAPPVPAFYNGPQSMDDMVAHFTGRLLDQLGVAHQLSTRWETPTLTV